MKRKALISFIVVNVLVIVALAGLFVLSEAYPLRPGGAFYRLQHVAEQWRMQLSGGEAGRAAMAVELAERRLGDLAQVEEPGDSNAAAVAFDRALEEAVRRVLGSPWPERGELEGELAALLGRAEVVLAGADGAGEGVVLGTLARKVEGLQGGEEAGAIAADLPEPVALTVAEPIPFLGQEIDHTVWPLTGGHEGLACEDCHQEGEYAGTAGACEDCHGLPESELYAEHFAGACEDCHLVDSWEPTGFDHEEIVDCRSCHEEESPEEHYTRVEEQWWLLSFLPSLAARGQESALLEGGHYDRCADCHVSVEEWEEVAFDHVGFPECMTCHELEGELAGHYPGECSLCHGTEDWEPLAYEHTAEECRPCHAVDSPEEHYLQGGSLLWYASWEPERGGEEGYSPYHVAQIPESCGNCHPDTEAWEVVRFDHEGFEDCEGCHAREGELAEHYGGQCSKCHPDTEGWEEVAFDHTGYTDCGSCHELEEVHYPDQCSLCHSIEEWQSVAFSHGGNGGCGSCHEWETPGGHYDRPCTECHTTEAWGEMVFEHRGADDCRTCHVLGYDHYWGQCSQCHSTETWSGAVQPHSGLIGCGVCHTVEPPHYGASCTNCHTASGWEEIDFEHEGYKDCRACHEAPEGHYPAQCSACHNTEGWGNYYVNHVALASCTSCHGAPGGHWLGECTLCHEAESWTAIVYSHYVGSDCASCHTAPAEHWPGQCSQCHNLTNWMEVTIDHSVLTDCLSCHPTPDGHWPGQCSSCHGTSSWDEYTFNHDGYDNCKACHGQERPASHERGQCSQCHTTDSWSVPTPTPEPTEEPTAEPTEEPTAEPAPTEESSTESGTESIAP